MKEPVTTAQLEAARRGNEAELAAVIARFMPAIHKMARKATGPGLDFEDAVQEGIIGLFSAIEHFKADRTVAFSTYATTCIYNSVLSAKRMAERKKHTPLNHSVPISTQHTVAGPEERTIANEQVLLAFEKARMLLSPLEKTVLRLYLHGYSYKQIAKRIQKSEKAVENALFRMRQKLR